MTLQAELQRLANRPRSDATECANVWAGTSGRALVEALNVKAGTVGLALQGVLNRIAGTAGLGPEAALRATVVPPKVTPAPSAVANAGLTATVSFTNLTSTPLPTSYQATSSPGGITATASGSPITVSGLTSLTSYTFTVTATNVVGTGPASDPSNSVTATL